MKPTATAVARLTLRPLADRVLLRPVDLTTEGAIIIPDMARERPAVGLVLDVGALVDEQRVQPGDHVFYGQFTGTPVTVTGEALLLIRVDDLLAVVEGLTS